MTSVSASQTPRQPFGRNSRGWPGSDAGDQHEADRNERQNRDDFDQREPVLELAEDAHMRRIDRDEHGGYPHDPQPRRHSGTPEREVDADGGHLRADRQDLDEGVRRTHGEAGPRREIAIGEHAERSRHRMHHRHFGERIPHDERDQRPEDVGHDHARPGQPDGDRAAEQQPDADRAAHRHHGDLARNQLSFQPLLCRDVHCSVARILQRQGAAFHNRISSSGPPRPSRKAGAIAARGGHPSSGARAR